MGPLKWFDASADIGGPRISGSTAYDPVEDSYTLVAGGYNMWGVRDEFQFAWTRLRGDFVIGARVEFVGAGSEPHCKAGCMVRPTLQGDAPYADAALHRDGLTALQYRRLPGGISDHVLSPVRGADVITFERRDGRFTFTASDAAGSSGSCELSDLDLGDEVYVGLFLCSHHPDATERAIFRDVRVRTL
jgi:hypothetical protein